LNNQAQQQYESVEDSVESVVISSTPSFARVPVNLSTPPAETAVAVSGRTVATAFTFYILC
jgi:hypothetical protein